MYTIIIIIETEIKRISGIYLFDLDCARLFTGVGLIGRTLKELYIDGRCALYYSLSLSLDPLPALTHLTIKLKFGPRYISAEYYKSVSKEMRQTMQTRNSNNNNYNLVFLCLDSEFRCCYDIKQVIRRCPRLEFLMVSDCTIYEYPEASAIEFAQFLELCPSIRYINWGEDTIPSNIEKEWLTLARRRSRDADHEYSNHCGKREANHLRQVGFCSYYEQQHISALTRVLQQPSSLEHLHLSGSFQVDLYQLWKMFTHYNSNLLSRPPPLKSLELVDICISREKRNGKSFHGLFRHFQHIERLEMCFFVTAMDSLKKERDYIYKAVRAIGRQLHQLRYLHLGVDCPVNIDTRMTLFDNLSTTLCHWNKKLEILHLNNVSISSDMLLDLCHHSKLHTLKLAGQQLHKHVTKDGWVSLARKLKKQEQRRCSTGRIRSILLSCDYCDDVTDEVLKEFAGVKSLETLQIERNRNITDEGVNKFASIRNNISKKCKIIKLYCCDNVSLDNPHVVFVPSSSF